MSIFNFRRNFIVLCSISFYFNTIISCSTNPNSNSNSNDNKVESRNYREIISSSNTISEIERNCFNTYVDEQEYEDEDIYDDLSEKNFHNSVILMEMCEALDLNEESLTDLAERFNKVLFPSLFSKTKKLLSPISYIQKLREKGELAVRMINTGRSTNPIKVSLLARSKYRFIKEELKNEEFFPKDGLSQGVLSVSMLPPSRKGKIGMNLGFGSVNIFYDLFLVGQLVDCSGIKNTSTSNSNSRVLFLDNPELYNPIRSDKGSHGKMGGSSGECFVQLKELGLKMSSQKTTRYASHINSDTIDIIFNLYNMGIKHEDMRVHIRIRRDYSGYNNDVVYTKKIRGLYKAYFDKNRKFVCDEELPYNYEEPEDSEDIIRVVGFNKYEERFFGRSYTVFHSGHRNHCPYENIERYIQNKVLMRGTDGLLVGMLIDVEKKPTCIGYHNYKSWNELSINIKKNFMRVLVDMKKVIMIHFCEENNEKMEYNIVPFNPFNDDKLFIDEMVSSDARSFYFQFFYVFKCECEKNDAISTERLLDNLISPKYRHAKRELITYIRSRENNLI